MSDHNSFVCPNEKTIESHGRQISELFEQGRDREFRMTEMETTLFGHERNGGGFIKDTKETMEVVRLGISTLSSKVDDLCSKREDKRTFRTTVLPALLTFIGAIIVAYITAKVGK